MVGLGDAHSNGSWGIRSARTTRQPTVPGSANCVSVFKWRGFVVCATVFTAVRNSHQHSNRILVIRPIVKGMENKHVLVDTTSSVDQY